MIQALRTCHNLGGASVANLSLSGGAYNETLAAEMVNQDGYGRNIVAASGNGGADGIGDRNDNVYPCAYADVTCVGATDRQGHMATFSNYGNAQDIVAPGVGIQSTYLDQTNAQSNGTSFSTPQVAGVISLLRAKGLTKEAAESRVFRYAEDRGAAGRDDIWGHGFLNARCAVTPSLTGC